MVRGYIDESYEGQKYPHFFTLSCSLAHGGEWEFIETAWRWILDEKKRELVAEGRKPIKRYHAVDCFNRDKDFKGWSRDERDSFVKSLYEVLRPFPTAHVSLSVSAKDIRAVWPENNEEDPLHFAYNILLRLMMLEIGNNRSRLRLAGAPISLIYERCGQYGESLLRGFKTMMDDPTFSYRDVFTTIAPMGWENCIPLQPADLVAYEVFRDMKRRALYRDMNRSFSALVELDELQLVSKRIERVHLVKVRQMVERHAEKKSKAQVA